MKRIALVLIFLVATGCSTTQREGTNPPVFISGERTEVRWNSVSIIDDAIRNKIAVQATDSRTSATGTMEVWAYLRNRTDFPLQVEGRVQFYDAGRKPIESPSAWKRLYLEPNAMVTYSESSTMLGGASYYYVELREGR